MFDANPIPLLRYWRKHRLRFVTARISGRKYPYDKKDKKWEDYIKKQRRR
jgi:hypothetical protein